MILMRRWMPETFEALENKMNALGIEAIPDGEAWPLPPYGFAQPPHKQPIAGLQALHDFEHQLDTAVTELFAGGWDIGELAVAYYNDEQRVMRCALDPVSNTIRITRTVALIRRGVPEVPLRVLVLDVTVPGQP